MKDINQLINHLEEARSHLAKANDFTLFNRKSARQLREARESVRVLLRELEEAEKAIAAKESTMSKW